MEEPQLHALHSKDRSYLIDDVLAKVAGGGWGIEMHNFFCKWHSGHGLETSEQWVEGEEGCADLGP
jgi:hypothetical protein